MAGLQYGSLVKALTINGTEFRTERTATANTLVGSGISAAAAKTGSLTAKTDGDTGTATMDPGHGLTTGRMDVYWLDADGVTRKARYGMTGTVTVNSIALDGGGGDSLPATSTALTITAPVELDFVVETANLKALAVKCASPAIAVFLDAADAVVKAVVIDGATDSYSWDSGDDAANPLSDDVTHVYLSQGGSASAQPLYCYALVN